MGRTARYGRHRSINLRLTAAAPDLAARDHLTAFGITPEHPETGYGYIKRGEALEGGFAIAEFVEKPDLERAKAYLESGDYSWNGGIFAFRAGVLSTLAYNDLGIVTFSVLARKARHAC